MNRITDKHLQSACDRLNRLTNSPLDTWESVPFDGGFRTIASVGNYHISRAYGGVCLHRHVNEGGGVNCPIVQGHIPKRELFNLINAYIRGIEFEQERNKGGQK